VESRRKEQQTLEKLLEIVIEIKLWEVKLRVNTYGSIWFKASTSISVQQHPTSFTIIQQFSFPWWQNVRNLLSEWKC